jgi:F-type H+-transporting ATPase subunit a
MESTAQNSTAQPPESTPPAAPTQQVESTPPAAPDPSEPNFFQKLWARIQAWMQANPRQVAMIGGAVLLLLLSFFIRTPDPHVSLAGEALTPGGWFTNSLLTTLVVDIILLVLAFLATRNMQLVPGGLQNAFEAILEYLYNLAESVTGKAAGTYFPWAATIFLFVLLSNYSGLIPGVGSIGLYLEEEAHASRFDGQLAMANGKLLLQAEGEGSAEAPVEEGAEEHATFVPLFRAPSADLSTTFALALSTMFMVQWYGYRALGGKYFRKFAFWSPSGEGVMKPINGFVMFLELISELSRILTFSFRLFGNIFAGEVVLIVMAFLVPFLVPVPFYVLEVLVGVIQALVFTMLALILFNLATISHEPGAEHH